MRYNKTMRAKGLILILLIVAVGLGVLRYRQEDSPSPSEETTKEVVDMKLVSSAFEEGQAIPAQYTCDGDNVSPPLTVSEVSEQAKSLAMIVDDPDAPAGDWVHWLWWNASGATAEIAENATPSGAMVGKNDFGANGYGGPCPPSGTHRYQFKLFALDAALDLPETSGKAGLLSAMEGHILEQVMLTGTYSR